MKAIDLNNKRVVISRTDSIGDVMLTLPLCAWIKENYPTAQILFLGKGYTRSVVESYVLVDHFEDWADYTELSEAERRTKFESLKADVIIHVFPNKEISFLAKKVKIDVRIGTSHRAYHLLTCNHRPSFTRKRSDLHEAQLNHELLRPLGLDQIPSLDPIIKATEHFQPKNSELPVGIQKSLDASSKSIVLHPKSQGSAKEWPMEKYIELANALIARGYTVFFTGTKAEGELFSDALPKRKQLVDTTGQMSLEQLLSFISKVDTLCACSTGPLHIAGYLGVQTIGFFSPKRPIHPGRWRALGSNVSILVNDEGCEKCAQKQDCDCIQSISVERVLNEIA